MTTEEAVAEINARGFALGVTQCADGHVFVEMRHTDIRKPQGLVRGGDTMALALDRALAATAEFVAPPTVDLFA